jgi:hypothetical protein
MQAGWRPKRRIEERSPEETDSVARDCRNGRSWEGRYVRRRGGGSGDGTYLAVREEPNGDGYSI